MPFIIRDLRPPCPFDRSRALRYTTNGSPEYCPAGHLEGAPKMENKLPGQQVVKLRVQSVLEHLLDSSKVTFLDCFLCLKSKPNIRIQAHVSIDLRKKLGCRWLRARRQTRQQQEECRHQPSSANTLHSSPWQKKKPNNPAWRNYSPAFVANVSTTAMF
jgi:hypothetical protein